MMVARVARLFIPPDDVHVPMAGFAYETHDLDRPAKNRVVLPVGAFECVPGRFNRSPVRSFSLCRPSCVAQTVPQAH